MIDCCYSNCRWGGQKLAYSHVARRAGRLDVPQGLHEGGVHLGGAIGDREVLQKRESEREVTRGFVEG